MNYNEDIPHDVKLRIGTQQERLAKFLWVSGRWHTASDFQGGNPDIFIGYEAATRLGDLYRKGFLEKRWREGNTPTGAKVMEYRFKHLKGWPRKEGNFTRF